MDSDFLSFNAWRTIQFSDGDSRTLGNRRLSSLHILDHLRQEHEMNACELMLILRRALKFDALTIIRVETVHCGYL